MIRCRCGRFAATPICGPCWERRVATLHRRIAGVAPYRPSSWTRDPTWITSGSAGRVLAWMTTDGRNYHWHSS